VRDKETNGQIAERGRQVVKLAADHLYDLFYLLYLDIKAPDSSEDEVSTAIKNLAALEYFCSTISSTMRQVEFSIQKAYFDKDQISNIFLATATRRKKDDKDA